MARKSRKVDISVPSSLATFKEIIKIYKTALYLRLSVLDKKENSDSESLANQQYMLEDFAAKQPELKIMRIFSDNGETGTNYNRPAWTKLLEACHAGEIDCIIVKDLSRLGRNYLETENYLETIFPSMDIRFIAVNDGYDSISLDSHNQMIFSMKNLINDIYAKDISRKTSTALQQKQKNGAFVGSCAAYGYMKIKEDKNKIFIDSETAPVVRQIFKWKADGVGTQQICRRLVEQEILSPYQYRIKKGRAKKMYYPGSTWNYNSIRTILNNPVYLGHLAQGKTKGAMYEGKKARPVPAKQWQIVENTHEPIITQELFDQAHQVIKKRKERMKADRSQYTHVGNPDNIFKGLLFCADCGKRINRDARVKNNRISWYYQCRTHRVFLDKGGTSKTISQLKLTEIVKHVISEKIKESADIERILTKMAFEQQHQAQFKQNHAEIEKFQADVKRIISKRQMAYNDYSSEILSLPEYQVAVSKYDQKIKELKKQLRIAEKRKKYLKRDCTIQNPYLVVMRKVEEKKDINNTLLTLLIKKIEVNHDRSIKIIWNFKDEYDELLHFIKNEVNL